MNHHLPPADPALDRFADLPNGLQLCFRTYGHPDHPPIVLIAGLGLQLVSWPQALIDGLVAEGLYVITLDNRVMGRVGSFYHAYDRVLRTVLTALVIPIVATAGARPAFALLLAFVLVSLVIVWFAGYVVYKLYKGQA